MENKEIKNIKGEILEKVRELASPALSEAGVELVDLTYRHESGGMVMRFTVDKRGGIRIGECGALRHWRP